MSGLRCSYLLGLLLIFGLSGPLPLRAQERESSFETWTQAELIPWFQAQPDQFLTSRVPSQKPVLLRYKTFIHPNAKAQIIIVHGYGERIEKHMEMAFDFYAAGYSVFALDQRGFGRSTRLHPTGSRAIYVDRFSDYAFDLEQFLAEVVQAHRRSLKNFIFAHSMGGLVSAHVLHDHPELIDAAVFSTPMLGIRTARVPRVIAQALADAAEYFGYGTRYAFGQSDPKFIPFDRSPTQSFPRWQFYADFFYSAAEQPQALGGCSFHWLGEALRSAESINSEAWASTITRPVLLFQAELDTYVDNIAQDDFCLRVRDCRKLFVAGARHEVYRELDIIRRPYMLSLLQFWEEQLAVGRNPSTPASHFWTE